MAYVVGVATSQFITLQVASLTERLLLINASIQRLSTSAVEATTMLMNYYRSSVTVNGGDIGSNTEDAAENIDIVNDDSFSLTYWEALIAQYNQQEKMLNVEKQQIETQIKAWNTQQESVDKMTDKNIQNAHKYLQ